MMRTTWRHAPAGAGGHGGPPVEDDRFRQCAAALAEDFGEGRHAGSSARHPAYLLQARTNAFVATTGRVWPGGARGPRRRAKRAAGLEVHHEPDGRLTGAFCRELPRSDV